MNVASDVDTVHEDHLVEWSAGKFCTFIVAVLATALPLISFSPQSTRWHGGKALIVDIVGLILLAFVACGVELQKFKDSKFQPQLPLAISFAAFLTWSCVTFAWSASPHFSIVAVASDLSAAGFVCTIAIFARVQRRLLLLVDSLSAAVLIITSLGLIGVGSEAGRSGYLMSDGAADAAVSTTHDHELFSSLCMVLLPMMLTVSLSPAKPKHRYLAQVALVFSGISLLVSQGRSAWLGEFAALTSFAVLKYVYRAKSVVPSRRKRRLKFSLNTYIPYAILAIGALVVLSQIPNLQGLQTRLGTLSSGVIHGKDLATEWRLHTWREDIKLVRSSPILGHGVGTYAIVQHTYTGKGQPKDYVLGYGPTLTDQAHDSYLQLAADVGVPGLALWLCVLCSVLYVGINSLMGLSPGGLHQCLVIGALSSVIGQTVDAIGNPAWQFSDICLYLWVITGILLAASTGEIHHKHRRAVYSKDNEVSGQFRVNPVGILLAVVAAGWLIYWCVSFATYLPSPEL